MIRSRLIAVVGFFAGMFAVALAHASPIVYTPAPLDTIQAMMANYNATLNATLTAAAPLTTATGSAGASTCNGLRCTITTESLTTAASTSYTETLTDSFIAANSQVNCQAGFGTATTGVPVAATITPGAGSAVIIVRNVSTSAALNGTITLSCQIWN
jgi:hypothetical protein